ncbi:hypothetical protein VB711_00315 [Cronbergia sp. UHCC 0137]|uniref:hypothetical protein n=1 Tax=Cronbergia sp. UHCC 0137 TaxID=3110239 RepID=UPI002B1EBFF2|nr:hypothetical protein [Cronbergia sp. UHCC 0137]MEA5616287.1 hypothetical protein [Cronbergia sp. UHCC 0137]
MKVSVSQEDIQLLADKLKEQLRTEVPSGNLFQVKCAIKNNELMVLIQHPESLIFDNVRVFVLLKDILRRQSNYQTPKVQFFIRVSGEKLPYAKDSLDLRVEESEEEKEIRLGIQTYSNNTKSPELIFPPVDLLNSPSPTTDTPIENTQFSFNLSSLESENEPEISDPAVDLDIDVNKPTLPATPILAGAVLMVAVFFGFGGYFLTNSCVIGVCQEVETAEQFKRQSPQLIRQSKSPQQLLAVQQQLEGVISGLEKIPQWSPRHQEARELNSSFSDQLAKIQQVTKALESASLAAEKTKIPASSLEELKAGQSLWRVAIAQLESIKPNSELYGLVKENLPSYRLSLTAVNQQLEKEEKFLKKLVAVKAVADAAYKREANVKSSSDWQRVESTWLVVINALKSISPDSAAHQEAQTLLEKYQPKLIAARDRANKELLASQVYQQAITAANQAKIHSNQNQWQLAVASWQEALEAMKQISPESLYHPQAQSFIQPYSVALTQAQEKLQLYGDLTQTRADLTSTCANTVKFCTFTIDNKGIIVRLTPEYNQALQSSSSNPDEGTATNMQNHYQSLQNALKVISENANLPLFIYSSQGQMMYTRMPQ